MAFPFAPLLGFHYPDFLKGIKTSGADAPVLGRSFHYPDFLKGIKTSGNVGVTGYSGFHYPDFLKGIKTYINLYPVKFFQVSLPRLPEGD